MVRFATLRPACVALLGSLASAPLPSLATGDAPACVPVLEVRFVEGAPRDRFEFSVPPTSASTIRTLRLDLAGSVGDLVFDIAPGGEGVEVYQPFRVERGDALLRDTVRVVDGARRIDLAFDGFGAGARFAFSIDVDDRLSDSELGRIRVSGSEMEGASLRAGLRGADGASTSVEARFGAGAAAMLVAGDCER